jgi:DNA-binding MarR family transcriptional regulator
MGTTRIANEAWAALFRAQATLAGEFAAGAVWRELTPREYGVLYALASAPDGLRISDLGADALLSQPGMSRLVARLEARRLVERADDPDDGRACRNRMTAAGADLQRRIGRAHAQQVTEAMTQSLETDELEQVRDLCRRLLPGRTPEVPPKTPATQER